MGWGGMGWGGVGWGGVGWCAAQQKARQGEAGHGTARQVGHEHSTIWHSRARSRARTSLLVRNSQTPSLATMRTISSGDNGWAKISGSATTPNASATESPIERVNAVPGEEREREGGR